jgi:hypothetical protein
VQTDDIEALERSNRGHNKLFTNKHPAEFHPAECGFAAAAGSNIGSLVSENE